MPERTKPLVLVADDEQDILALVVLRLEQAGYDVATAEDGEEALELANKLQPDLAILDVMMPRRDGVEVTKELRDSEQTRELPVILLTARVQEADVYRGYVAGADEYLKKPFRPEELRDRVDAVLGRA